MDKIVANLDTLKNLALELNERSKYFANKKNTFTNNYFGNCATLTNFLKELCSSYTCTSKNILEVYYLLNDFVLDMEALEKKSAYGYGYVTVEQVNTLLNGINDSIKKYEIDPSILFEITRYGLKAGYADGKDVTIGTIGASIAVGAFSALEGVVNIVEMVGDAGAMAVTAGASALGFEDVANSFSSFVESDWSRNLYSGIVEGTGLAEASLIDPNGTAANVLSMGGTIAGMIGISVATGGIAAGAYGAGSTTATAVTGAVGAGVGASTALGSEAEAALQSGATVGEAMTAGLAGAAVGGLIGAAGGVFDAGARAATGVGQIVKNTIASFAMNSTEPLINEICNTAIYRHDENESYLANLFNNFGNDGIVLQMLLAGGVGAAGTAVNGYLGLRANNMTNVDNTANTANVREPTNVHHLSETEIELRQQEMADLLLNNPELLELWRQHDKGNTVRVYDDLVDDFNRLIDLQAEIHAHGAKTDTDTLMSMAVRDLTEAEIKVKIYEYRNLLRSDARLDAIMRQKVLGEVYTIPDDLQDVYNRMLRLETEIKEKRGIFTLDEFQQLEFSSIGKDLDSTSRLFTVSSLLQVLQNDDAYRQAFLVGDSDNATAMANAIKDLLDAANKNGYDLGLTDAQLKRAQDIIATFSIDYYAFYKDLYTDQYIHMVESDTLYSTALDDDYMQCLHNLKILAQERADDLELSNIVEKMSDYQSRVVTAMVEANYVIKDDVQYNNFLTFLRNYSNEDIISPVVFDYILNNAGEHTVYSRNERFVEQIKRAVRVTSDFDEVVAGRFHYFMDGYVSNDAIDSLADTFKFAQNSYIQKEVGQNTMAYNDGINCVMGFDYAEDTLLSNVSHETLHQLSHKVLANSDNYYESVSGVSVYSSDGTRNVQEFSGLNEAITEFFNQTILFDYDVQVHSCGYQYAVDRLGIFLDKKLFSLDELKQAYFGNDIGIIRDAIIGRFGDAKYFDIFINNFDGAISDSWEVRESALNELDKLIMMLS